MGKSFKFSVFKAYFREMLAYVREAATVALVHVSSSVRPAAASL
jgi:hypothetical protein